MTPAPSPSTKPSRSLSHGRLAASGLSLLRDKARAAAKPPIPNGDDAFSAFQSQQPLSNVYENLLFDRNPPLYFFLLHYWIKLFGLNVFFLKGLSVVFTTGIAILLWKISVKYFNQLTGLLVSVFFIFFNE